MEVCARGGERVVIRRRRLLFASACVPQAATCASWSGIAEGVRAQRQGVVASVAGLAIASCYEEALQRVVGMEVAAWKTARGRGRRVGPRGGVGGELGSRFEASRGAPLWTRNRRVSAAARADMCVVASCGMTHPEGGATGAFGGQNFSHIRRHRVSAPLCGI